MSRKLSRRDLLKVAQVGGLGAAAVTAGVAARDPQVTRKRAVCRLCTMHCGTIVTLRDGRLIRVEGDPQSQTRGFVCLNGHAVPEMVRAPGRASRPLVRRGTELAPVSWEEALTFTAAQLQAIAARYGPRALFVQTGWPFVRHPLVALLQRFVHAFGSPNLATIASLCEASARMGRALTCGTNYLPDLEKASTLVVWGANPTHAAPPFAHLVGGFGRTAGKSLVAIDPMRNEVTRAATLHLQIRPGTDGALALAFIDCLRQRGSADARVAAQDPEGFASLMRLASEYPAGRAAELCGLTVADIERAVDLMLAGKPTAVWSGLGIEHHVNGVQTVRAVSCFEALLGSLTDGAAQLAHRASPQADNEPLAQLYRLATAEPVPPEASDRPVGHDAYPLFDVYNRQAHGMLLPAAVLEDDPYPVRALILVGCNPLVSFPDGALMRRVFDKLELIVTVDPFMSASARASHVVLPAATFVESEVIQNPRSAHGQRAEKIASGRAEYEGDASAEAVIEPLGEARPDWRIVFDLAAALGLGAYFPWRSLREALQAPTRRWLRDPERELYADKGAPTVFATPSGRIELASPTMLRFGHDPLPSYQPPGDAPSAELPLILVTGPRERSFINSQLRTVPSVRRKLPEPLLRIHPQTAAPLGITDGDLVEVTTRAGRLTMKARLGDDTRPDTVIAPHGWEEANANVLVPGDVRDPISGFPAFRYQPCRVRRVASA